DEQGTTHAEQDTDVVGLVHGSSSTGNHLISIRAKCTTVQLSNASRTRWPLVYSPSSTSASVLPSTRVVNFWPQAMTSRSNQVSGGMAVVSSRCRTTVDLPPRVSWRLPVLLSWCVLLIWAS